MWRTDSCMKQDPQCLQLAPLDQWIHTFRQLPHLEGTGRAGFGETVMGSQTICNAKHHTVGPLHIHTLCCAYTLGGTRLWGETYVFKEGS